MNSRGTPSTPPELRELRASLDARLGALEAALADPKQHSSLEKIILDLARLATEEADATARHAVGAVRTEGLSALEAERAVAESLRQAVEDAQAALQSERAANAGAREQLAASQQRLDEVQARINELERQLADASQAREQAQAERTTLRRELETALGTIKTERAAAAAGQQELAGLRQAREQDQAERATFKRELENALVLLKAERTRVAGLEQSLAQANSETEAARAAAAAHERERAAAQQALEAERQTGQSATESERATAKQLRERVAELERTIDGMRRDGEARVSTLSGSQAELEQTLSQAQQTAAAAEGRTNELQARLDQALELAANARLRAEEAQAQLEEEQARAAEAILERDSLKEELAGIHPAEGLDHAEAPAKFEELLHSSEQRIRSLELALREAETRAESAELELELQRRKAAPASQAETVPQEPPPVAQFPGPPRTATRVTIPGDLAIEVDGAAATLIDVSLTGVQILAQAAMKPNRLVRLTLPHASKTIVCKGKVMWARLEPRAGNISYRAGILFTAADQAALEAFLNAYDPGT